MCLLLHPFSALSQHIKQRHGLTIVMVQWCMISLPWCIHGSLLLLHFLPKAADETRRMRKDYKSRWKEVVWRDYKEGRTFYFFPGFILLCIWKYQHLFSYYSSQAKPLGSLIFVSGTWREPSTLGCVWFICHAAVCESGLCSSLHLKVTEQMLCCWHVREWLLFTSSWKTKINLPLPPLPPHWHVWETALLSCDREQPAHL